MWSLERQWGSPICWKDEWRFPADDTDTLPLLSLSTQLTPSPHTNRAHPRTPLVLMIFRDILRVEKKCSVHLVNLKNNSWLELGIKNVKERIRGGRVIVFN